MWQWTVITFALVDGPITGWTHISIRKYNVDDFCKHSSKAVKKNGEMRTTLIYQHRNFNPTLSGLSKSETTNPG